MKTKIAILLLVGLGITALPGYGQNENAQTAAKAAQPKAADLDTKPAEGSENEVVESIKYGEDTPLAKIIMQLASQARTNLNIDPALIGSPSMPSNTIPAVKFENVTPLQALRSVLNLYGLTIIPDPENRVGKVVKQAAVPPAITVLLQLKFSNPTNIADIIKLSFVANKAVAIPDGRTSQLIVSAIPSDMTQITNLVAMLDLPTRQVLIEARIMETLKNPSSIKGIDWSGTLAGQNVSFGNGFAKNTDTLTSPGGTVSSTTTLPSGRTLNTTTTQAASSTTVRQVAFDALNSVPGLSANTMGGLTPSTAFLTADGLKVVMSFLNQDTDTRVVSTPRAVTLDNELAVLSVTRAFPVFKFTPGSANVAAGVDVTWTNLGTILNVTPRIAGNDLISLKVIPEVSSIDSKDRQTINGQVNEANVYAIRKIDTKVMIPSGHTLVMGGLISDQKTKSQTKVPFLGDLPGVGSLFKRDSKAVNQQNLIIFITPTIVRDTDFSERDAKDAEFLKTKYVEQPEEDPKKKGKKKPE